ncbi:double-strand break repair helicase AddA [Parapedomonas caeni]
MTERRPALTPEQARAAAPDRSAWVSASAGSGKTQVLTARVLRLLLAGSRPEAVLCITFTKAAAAEMADRLFRRLGAWARADDATLTHELESLGETATRQRLELARTLFARTLDTEGGLRIQTLHALAQSLLASFPLEAGVSPGFTTLDERTAAQAIDQTVNAEVAHALSHGRQGLLDDITQLSIGGGPQRFLPLVANLVRQGPRIIAFAGSGGASSIEPRLRRLFDLPLDGGPQDWLASGLGDGALDRPGLDRLARAWAQGAKTDQDKAARLTAWLARDVPGRAAAFEEFCGLFLKADGTPFADSKMASKGALAAAPDALAIATVAANTALGLLDGQKRFAIVEHAGRHLRLGLALATAMTAYKERVGALSFDDLIAGAARLLRDTGAAWVRYKLDLGIDHVLVDEAQDTNADQWAIVGAITEEFFAGLGAREDKRRSVFAVGDVKQAIFGFQGTDPATFVAAEQRYATALADIGEALDTVPLDRSFRSTDAVLRLVDAVLEGLGAEALGLGDGLNPHVAARAGQTGAAVLWAPIEGSTADDAEDDESPAETMDWEPPAERRFAERLAAQIDHWLRAGERLEARDRAMRAGDILVLVRRRNEFVTALVAELAHRGVPVAGVDRMALADPLVVQDLLDLVRFALLPEDDLVCAQVLKSPFIGWDETALFTLAYGRERQSLWARLCDRAEADPGCAEAHARLGRLLALADWAAPYEFLEAALSEAGGRARALARFGPQAADPIDILLEQALQFEREHAPSLQGFLDWIERGDVEVKRDPEVARDEVRVMTVHGAKGLQAPVVIVADTFAVPEDRDGMVLLETGDGATVPVWYGGRDQAAGPVAEALARAEQRTAQEHARLLYVALTRAEDRLYVGGWKPRKKRQTRIPCWYDSIDAAFDRLGVEAGEDPLWGSARRFVVTGDVISRDKPHADTVAPLPAVLPAWAVTPAPAEPRPPRPLAPSRLGDEPEPPAASPMGRDQRAARRGSLIHRLLERLPVAAPAARATLAEQWLARQAPELEPAALADIVTTVTGVLADPLLAALFGPQALAEVPLSAVFGEVVVAGQVDRLLVEADRVLVVDIKTGARIPEDAAATPIAYLRQMAAYRAALARMFPDRRIEAALLWTAAPRLMPLPDDLLTGALPFAV